jgi:tetratricopeptide (TPR) repeat protein
MLRISCPALLLAILFSAVSAPAQQPDETWKKLFTQGIYANSSKDYAKAEQSFLSALHEAERFGTDDLRVGSTENTLGLVYVAENKFGDAEAAYRKALTIFEKAYGANSLDVANVNFNIATVLFNQGHQIEAMPYLRKAQQVFDGQLGGASEKTAAVLCMEGEAARVMKNYTESEGMLRRCADVRESAGGVQNAEFAEAMYSLAQVYVAQGKYALADSRFKLVEKIRESTLGLTSPLLAQTMEEHATLLKSMGRAKDAEKLSALAAAIRRNQSRK